PTLPDPYAANFNVPLEGGRETVARLDCRVQWTAPDTPVLSFAFLPLEANRPLDAALAAAVPVGVREPRARTAADIRLGAQPLLAVADLQQRDPQKIIQ